MNLLYIGRSEICLAVTYVFIYFMEDIYKDSSPKLAFSNLEHLRVQKIHYMEVVGGHGATQNRQPSKHTAQCSSQHNYSQSPQSAHAIIFFQ